MDPLQTKRLELRPFRPEDVDALYGYAANPNVGPAAGWKPHKSREESAAIVADFIQKGEVLAITLKEGGRLIGSIGLHPDYRRQIDRTASLGYVLDQTYWGQGYMTEAVRAVLAYAFEKLDMRLVSVQHFTFNDRSRRVIERSGFVYEGTLRCAFARFDGAILDEACYSMTAQEYQASKERFY